MKKDGIKVDGFRGKWYVISEAHVRGSFDDLNRYYLVEHETYGDETEHLILIVNPVTKEYEMLLDDIWNGFDDLLERYGMDEFDLVIDD